MNKLKRKESQRKYYEKNKFECCKKRITTSLENSLKRVKKILKNDYESTIDEYRIKYPFDSNKFYSYAFKILRNYGIKSNYDVYDECISWVYISYDYSIHRATINKCNHVENYIKCMIRVFIVCVLNTYNREKEYLLKELTNI